MPDAYDCLVIGGGPAGSTVAALVAGAGFRTLLVEQQSAPQPDLGESLMPESYWVRKRLGVLERIKAAGFPRKYGMHLLDAGDHWQRFYFFRFNPHESSVAWQVRRDEFDRLLLECAAADGAECREGTRAAEVLFGQQGACGARLQDAAGELHEVAARVVVDASGRQTLLGSQLGLRQPISDTRWTAVWGRYRGAQRAAGIDEGTTLLVRTNDRRAWFWYVPLSDDLTSVGVVGDAPWLAQERIASTAFEEALVRCPAVADRLADAGLAADLRRTRLEAYRCRPAAGDGWLLVGDACTFVDPLGLSGAYLPLKCGELAAEAIVHGLRGGNLSAAALGNWCGPFDRGASVLHRLVAALQNPTFEMGSFLRRHPQHRDGLGRLLAGKLFDDEAALVADDLEPYLHRNVSTEPAQ